VHCLWSSFGDNIGRALWPHSPALNLCCEFFTRGTRERIKNICLTESILHIHQEHLSVQWTCLSCFGVFCWAKETISSAFLTVVMGNLILTAVHWNKVRGSLLVVNWNICSGSTACHITKWSDWKSNATCHTR